MKVSVLMITYNHGEFISQAIDSVLMQEVNFDYEIIIGEDCSRDDTRNIVITYQKKYPDKIRLFLPEKNLGATNNFASTLKVCQGEYIAMLEGDDYWTSPKKLQKQVDFLDNHPACSLCFHNIREFYEDDSKEDYIRIAPRNKQFFTSQDLYDSNFIGTCSIFFRRLPLAKLPDWSLQVYGADWLIQILCVQFGTIGYIDEVMGAWRIHKRGIWSGISYIQQRKNMITDFELMRKHLISMNNSSVSNRISKWYFDWAVAAIRDNNPKAAKTPIIKSFIESPINSYINNYSRIKLLVKIYFHGYIGLNIGLFLIETN